MSMVGPAQALRRVHPLRPQRLWVHAPFVVRRPYAWVRVTASFRVEASSSIARTAETIVYSRAKCSGRKRVTSVETTVGKAEEGPGMHTYKTTARTVGVLFIAGTVAGVQSVMWVKRILVLGLLVVVISACGSSDGNATGAVETRDTSTSLAATDTVASDAPKAGSQGTTNSGGGEFSVLMVANVDDLTAGSTLQSLEDAGFDGFIMEGSAENGFDLYRPGLTWDEANDLLAEIQAAPDLYGGLVYETAKIPDL